MGVLHQHDRGVHHRSDRDRNPAQAHDVRVDLEEVHRHERQRHGDRKREHRHQGAAQVEQEDEDHQAHHQHLLEQRVAQRLDRAVDQVRPVVDDPHVDAGRERGLHLHQLALHALDHLKRVFAVAHHHRAAYRLAIEVRGAAPDVGAERHVADVGDPDRRAAPTVGAERDLAQIVEILHVATAAHEVLASRHLDHAAADVGVAAANRRGDFGEREPEGVELGRIHLDLVLALVAPHRGDLCHTGDTGERVAELEVLEGAQVGEIVPSALVHQRVLEHPAHRRGVGAERRGHALR